MFSRLKTSQLDYRYLIDVYFTYRYVLGNLEDYGANLKLTGCRGEVLYIAFGFLETLHNHYSKQSTSVHSGYLRSFGLVFTLGTPQQQITDVAKIPLIFIGY